MCSPAASPVMLCGETHALKLMVLSTLHSKATSRPGAKNRNVALGCVDWEPGGAAGDERFGRDGDGGQEGRGDGEHAAEDKCASRAE